MKDFGKVSIIMPAYNAENFIAEAIQSVLQQTYQNWELIIVNDFSIDATESIVASFDDNRIKYYSFSKNKGTHHARNKAILEACGEFIAFLDADDRWKPEKLFKQLTTMSQQSLAACFSSYELMNENGKSLNLMIKAIPLLKFSKLKKANYVGNLTGIYSVKKLGKIRCPPLAKRQDWGLWLQVLEKSGVMVGIQEPLATYRIRKNSISSNKIKMLKYNFQVYHKVLNFSKVKSFFWMIIFLREQLFVKPKQTEKLN